MGLQSRRDALHRSAASHVKEFSSCFLRVIVPKWFAFSTTTKAQSLLKVDTVTTPNYGATFAIVVRKIQTKTPSNSSSLSRSAFEMRQK
jgi:hypothetical protein